MELWKISFLSKGVICRFQVNLPGCTSWKSMGWKTILSFKFSIAFFQGRTGCQRSFQVMFHSSAFLLMKFWWSCCAQFLQEICRSVVSFSWFLYMLNNLAWHPCARFLFTQKDFLVVFSDYSARLMRSQFWLAWLELMIGMIGTQFIYQKMIDSNIDAAGKRHLGCLKK